MKIDLNITSRNYKGFEIDYNVYGTGEYTVQYCGDDIWFNTEEEAKKFIDEVTE